MKEVFLPSDKVRIIIKLQKPDLHSQVNKRCWGTAFAYTLVAKRIDKTLSLKDSTYEDILENKELPLRLSKESDFSLADLVSINLQL
jgi:hypothetical protein